MRVFLGWGFIAGLAIALALSACGEGGTRPASTLAPTTPSVVPTGTSSLGVTAWPTTATPATEQLAATPTAAATFAPRPRSTATPEPSIKLEEVTLVTDSAAVGNFNNAWGGHQSRIVRTANGDLFTVYLVDARGDSPNDREFRLARKTPGGWSVIDGGAVFGEPVHLVRGPGDDLFIVGAVDQGKMAVWMLTCGAEKLVRTDILGAWHEGNPAYSAVGISADGVIYLMASNGGGGASPGGLFQWAKYTPENGQWSDVFELQMDYRYAYAYLFPGHGDGLDVVANRDVLWTVLGQVPKDGTSAYAFNAIGYWHADGSSADEFKRIIVHEEAPTETHPQPDTFNNYKGDAYRDALGRVHVVYVLRGAGTGGEEQLWHAIIEDEEVIHNGRLPVAGGRGGVLSQDTQGRLYLLTYAMNGSPNDSLAVYAAEDETGTLWSAPVHISLGGRVVRYSGITLATPRGGTQLTDFIDGAFPAGDNYNSPEWVHFRLRLR